MWSLALSALVQALSAVAFVAVSRLLRERHADTDHEGPARAFRSWWIGLAVYVALEAVVDALAAVGRIDRATLVLAQYLEIGALAFGAWGLTFFVLYLFTGKPWMGRVVAAYMALVGIWWAWLTAANQSAQVVVHRWEVTLEPAPPHLGLVFVSLGVPAILSSLAYLSLVLRTRRRVQRYRILLVGLSVLAWVTTGLWKNSEQNLLWGALSVTGLGLVTAGSVFLAYRPPARVAAWLEEEAPDDLVQSRSS